jgi:2-oxo-4-hydroxy-4-carboxy-5-ureidoimidazoline decarboxylase
MRWSVEAIDGMPADRAAGLLAECCGASRWVRAMVERRPFRRREALFSAAGEVWRSLAPDDWKEAFAHHPRIGERSGALAQGALGEGWSAGEQAGVSSAEEATRRALAEVNRQYEARFGYVYIVCATGRSAEEMLALARRRLVNDPAAELAVAAEEQEKIMLLRLEKLLGDHDGGI